MKFDNDALTLTKADINVLIAFTSRDTTRILAYVLVEPTKRRVTATDGHRLVRYCGPVPPAAATNGHQSYLVSRATLAAAAKLASKKCDVTLRAQRQQNGAKLRLTVEVAGTMATIDVATDDGFPNVDAVWAELANDAHDDCPNAKFDANYLADLLLVQKAAGAAGVILRKPTCKTAPLAFHVEDFDGGRWEGLVMPMAM